MIEHRLIFPLFNLTYDYCTVWSCRGDHQSGGGPGRWSIHVCHRSKETDRREYHSPRLHDQVRGAGGGAMWVNFDNSTMPVVSCL